MIYCISDLHACDHSSRDNFSFKDREERFNDFLNWIEKQNAKLFIIGDLMDWWQVNFSLSVNEYQKLLDRFENMQATYIVGNHDNTLTNFIGTDKEMPHPFFKRMVLPFEQIIGNRKFVFLHGHELDPYCNNKNPSTGEIITILAGLLEDLNHSPFTGNMAVEDELTFLGSKSRLYNNIQNVELYRKNKNADVVVYGHTHEAGNIGDYHFNTGSWARQIDTFVKIDDEGKASVWEWKKDVGPIPFEKTLLLIKNHSTMPIQNSTEKLTKNCIIEIYNKILQ